MNLNDAQKNELVRVLMSQTDYSEEDAHHKLEEANYDILKVIRAYMKPDTMTQQTNGGCAQTATTATTTATATKNQTKFTEIRHLMEAAEQKFRRDREKELLYKQYYEEQARRRAAELQSVRQETANENQSDAVNTMETLD